MNHNYNFEISASGVLTKFRYKDKNFTELVIPDGVRKIGENAFAGSYHLTSVVIPNSVTTIEKYAFYDCVRLEEIVIPEKVNKIDDFAFAGCTSMKRAVLPNRQVKIENAAFFGCSNMTNITMSASSLGGKPFGDTGKTIEVTVLRDNMAPVTVVGAFRKTYWSQTFDYKEDFLLPLEDKDLPYYDRLVATGDYEGFKMNEQGRMKAMIWRMLEKDRPVSAEYLTMFVEFIAGKFNKFIKIAEEDERPEYIRKVIESGAITEVNRKKITGQLKKSCNTEIQKFASQIDEIIGRGAEAHLNGAEPSIDGKYLNQLKKINAKAVLMKYGVESIPEISLADKTGKAPEQYLQLILAEYMSQYKKGEYIFSPLADEVAKLFNQEELVNAIVGLYENSNNENNQKAFLPVIFRYADGKTLLKFYRKYKDFSWMESVIDKCLILNDSREAMLLVEKSPYLLKKYADLRGKDVEFIRYSELYDFGFDQYGKKEYDLGSTKLEVTLNPDLSISLYDTAKKKIVKSIPKKNTDSDLYSLANKDLSEMKKNLKKVINSFAGSQFKMFLSGEKTDASQWTSVNLKNPVLRQISSLLVWDQNGKTFTVRNGELIDVNEQPFVLGKEEVCVAHPMEMPKEEVENWQKYFIRNKLRQPFEQIWEPVVDFDTISDDRYTGIYIPVYRFKGQEKHGITFNYSFGGFESLYIGFGDCSLEYFDGGCMVGRHEIDMKGNLNLGKFNVRKKSRNANHIINMLDCWTMFGRILLNEAFTSEMLKFATLAQITNYLKFANENNCMNASAVLIDYRNEAFAEYDPMDEFTLDL